MEGSTRLGEQVVSEHAIPELFSMFKTLRPGSGGVPFSTETWQWQPVSLKAEHWSGAAPLQHNGATLGMADTDAAQYLTRQITLPHHFKPGTDYYFKVRLAACDSPFPMIRLQDSASHDAKIDCTNHKLLPRGQITRHDLSMVSHADGSLEVVMRWSPEQDTEQLRLVVFPASGVSAEGYSKQATGSIVVSEVAWAAVTQP